MFVEDNGLHVGQIHHHVNDGELEVRIFLRHFLDSRCLGEARRNDGRVALVGKVADGLLALGLVGDLKFAIGHARVGLEFLRAIVHGLVERLVELAANVEHDGRLVIRRECGRCHEARKRHSAQELLDHDCLPVIFDRLIKP